MHDFLCRLFFYMLAIMFLNTAFSAWPESNSAAFYFVYYGSRFIPYVALFEAGYQVAVYVRRRNAIENAPTKELEVPETNRLDRK